MIHSTEAVHRIDRVTIAGVTYESQGEQIGQLVVATPNSGGVKYARLQFDDGASYKWNGNPDDIDANTSRDPLLEPRWIEE